MKQFHNLIFAFTEDYNNILLIEDQKINVFNGINIITNGYNFNYEDIVDSFKELTNLNLDHFDIYHIMKIYKKEFDINIYAFANNKIIEFITKPSNNIQLIQLEMLDYIQKMKNLDYFISLCLDQLIYNENNNNINFRRPCVYWN